MLRRTFASAAAAQKTGRERLRPSAALFQHREAIGRIVAVHGASDPRVFGSVLLGTDPEASDLDLLVEPDPGFTLFGVAGIMTELQGSLRRCLWT